MFAFLQGPGFLGTIGRRLTARRRYEARRWVQTAAACLIAALILAWMIRSFVLSILPGIPGSLGTGSYAVTTVRAVVGALGLGLGLFVVLRDNELVPQSLRFSNYQRFMKGSYARSLLGTLSGAIVYYVVYEGGSK